MKFSHAVVMLALLSSSLFRWSNGDGKKFSFVEAASTQPDAHDDKQIDSPPPSTQPDAHDDKQIDSPPPSIQPDAHDDKQIDSPPPSSTADEATSTPLSVSTPDASPVQPTQQEKTILSTILKSFKNGHVDLPTLASALNDPNVSKLASSLSKANLNKLAEVLDEPKVDLSKLVAALSDPDLNLDKLVATFGDPKVLPPTSFKPAHDASGGIMSMMKNWAGQLGDSLKGHMTLTSPNGATDKGVREKFGKAPAADTHGKQGAGVGSDVPTDFERSTPSPDANTYGKSLLTGMDVTKGTTTGDITLTEMEGEQAQSTFDHKLIYYAVAGMLGLTMCIYLATRLSKSYRGEEVEETRSSIRLVA